jgi:hypothetical protein
VLDVSHQQMDVGPCACSTGMLSLISSLAAVFRNDTGTAIALVDKTDLLVLQCGMCDAKFVDTHADSVCRTAVQSIASVARTDPGVSTDDTHYATSQDVGHGVIPAVTVSCGRTMCPVCRIWCRCKCRDRTRCELFMCHPCWNNQGRSLRAYVGTCENPVCRFECKRRYSGVPLAQFKGLCGKCNRECEHRHCDRDNLHEDEATDCSVCDTTLCMEHLMSCVGCQTVYCDTTSCVRQHEHCLVVAHRMRKHQRTTPSP